MVKKKYKSKRQSLHDKYKIAAKVREHNRKARREAKKNPDARKKLKKDPGIPNLWPLKEEFLQKIQNQKAKLEEEKERQKEDRLKEHQKKRNMATLASEAKKREKEFQKKQKEKEQEHEDVQTDKWAVKDGSKKAYFREFKKILETADVVLEVLDARDPLGSRCPDIEKKIIAKDPNKKIILVLNKIDLVPKENVTAWLKYLRNEYPTIAFKCTTQEQRKGLSQTSISTDIAPNSILQSSECLGADILIQLLKNYSRNLKLKTSIAVGIIGYPNVGKSSLINSLKRSKAVGVGATPGFTKTVQEIYLDKNVKLIDCPGIVFANGNTDNDIILRNCVKVEQIPDPIEPVEVILRRCKAQQLMEIYKLPQFSTVNEFLLHVAKKKGKLIKGGVPDMKAAARSILQDWNGGKIPFFTVPPLLRNVHVSAELVTSWGKEFDLDNLLQSEGQLLAALPDVDTSAHMQMEPGVSEALPDELFEEGEEDDDEDVENMEEVDEEDSVPATDTTSMMSESANPSDLKGLLRTSKSKAEKRDETAANKHNPQHNKMQKKLLKKAKKQQKKSKDGMSDDEDKEIDYDTWNKKNKKVAFNVDEVDEDEDYSFATDFKPKNKIQSNDDDIDLDDV